MKPYVLPFALYLIFTQLAAQLTELYPILYSMTVIGVGAVTFVLLYRKPIVKIHANVGSGVVVGVVGVVAWIVICRLELVQSLGFIPDWLRPENRVAFNPFLELEGFRQWGFIGIRMIGLALLVPVVEEIFWRGFLMRWVISPDWQEQEIGVFSLKSFVWVTLLFTVAHPEWFAAAVYCTLLNLLLYWRRDLWNCIVAHGTSNFLLGVYVMYSGTWDLW